MLLYSEIQVKYCMRCNSPRNSPLLQACPKPDCANLYFLLSCNLVPRTLCPWNTADRWSTVQSSSVSPTICILLHLQLRRAQQPSEGHSSWSCHPDDGFRCSEIRNKTFQVRACVCVCAFSISILYKSYNRSTCLVINFSRILALKGCHI